MKPNKILLLSAIGLAAAGAFTSYRLLAKHMHVPGGPAWLDALCESGGTGHISCDKVLASRWGMFPPTAEGETGKKGQLPVALIGVAYFSTLLIWLVAVGRPNRPGRGWHLLPLLLNAAGLAGSVGFIKIMAFELDTWCPLCLATHAINLLLFIVNVLLWPRRTRSSDEADSSSAPTPAYPSLRLALVVVVSAYVLAQFETQSLTVAVLQQRYTKMAAVVNDVQKNINTLVSLHLAAEPRQIEVRPDDPIRYMADNAPTVVVWSDFACSHCRKFAENFAQKYAEHFGGYLRLVYKHYPVCSDCNPYVGRRTHPVACGAARFAEAVRILAGNDGFWRVHDLLFDAQKTNKEKMDIPTVAESLGLDPDKVLDAMRSEEVRQRIAQDIELAHKLGVHATPTVYLEGREVSNLAREVDGFWSVIGRQFQRIRTAKELAEQQEGG